MTKEEARKKVSLLRHCLEDYEDFPLYIHDEDLTALDMAISALKEEWIPIEENEPEESMDVYITLEVFDRPPFVEKAFFFKTQRKYFAHGITVDPSSITAWQPWKPLPEPYKKGE